MLQPEGKVIMRREATPMRTPHARLWVTSLALVAMILALLAPTLPARAEELPPSVRALLDAIGLQFNLRPKVGAVHEIENGYELRDITFFELKTDDGAIILSLRTARMRITGLQERNGLFLYTHVRLEDTVFEGQSGREAEEKVRLEVPVMDMVEASVLPESAARNELERLASSRVTATVFSMPQATIILPKLALRWHGLKITWKGDRRQGTGVTDTDFGEIVVPLKEAARLNPREGARNAAVLERLGLEMLTITGHARQEVLLGSDGRLHSSSRTRIGAKEAGFLEVAVQDVSFPVAMLEQLRQYVERMRNEEAAGMRDRASRSDTPSRPGYNPLADPVLMNIFSQLSLRGLSIGWEDRGITRKILQLAAEHEGRSMDALVRERLQQAQVFLSAFLPPDLLEKTLNALLTFLRDPKSIRLSVKGANGQPLTVPALASALINPQTLFTLVEIHIAANE